MDERSARMIPERLKNVARKATRHMVGWNQKNVSDEMITVAQKQRRMKNVGEALANSCKWQLSVDSLPCKLQVKN